MMQLSVNLDAIFFHELSCCFIIALALDSLHFSKQFAKSFAEQVVVKNFDKMFAVCFDDLYCFGIVLERPS